MSTVTLTLMAVAAVLLSGSWTGGIVLGLSFIGSLYQWPFLRGASRPAGTDTPKEQEPGTVAETDHQDTLVDGSLILAEFPSEILVQLAETLGNPLALLVSKAHLSKAFCEAARNAQGLLKQADLREWSRTVDDAAVAAVVSKCTELTTLSLGNCIKITDVAVLAVASGCKQLTSLNLYSCYNITDAALLAVASECKQLTTLNLDGCGERHLDEKSDCDNITQHIRSISSSHVLADFGHHLRSRVGSAETYALSRQPADNNLCFWAGSSFTRQWWR